MMGLGAVDRGLQCTCRLIVCHLFWRRQETGLEEDIEARDIWRNFLPAEHILPFGCKVSTSVDLPCHRYAGFGLSLPYMIC
jgi:hypothetical protein